MLYSRHKKILDAAPLPYRLVTCGGPGLATYTFSVESYHPAYSHDPHCYLLEGRASVQASVMLDALSPAD